MAEIATVARKPPDARPDQDAGLAAVGDVLRLVVSLHLGRVGDLRAVLGDLPVV